MCSTLVRNSVKIDELLGRSGERKLMMTFAFCSDMSFLYVLLTIWFTGAGLMCPPEKERTEEQKKQAKIVEQNISVGNLTIKKKN